LTLFSVSVLQKLKKPLFDNDPQYGYPNGYFHCKVGNS
jgi:hypothetical protein